MSLQSILTGSDVPLRKTRFHDEKGNLVSLKYFVLHGPRSLASYVGMKVLGLRPEKPWLSYAAVRKINKFLTKDKTVLEFGSGMSTIWFAKKSKYVYSVEDYEPWYQKVRIILDKKQMKNVDYNLKQGDDYSSFMKNGNVKFDFILVDGYAREKCMENAFQLIKEHGIIYLDNSDKDSSVNYAKDQTRLAEERLLKFAKERGATVSYFSDFAPTAFFVQQGMMVEL